MSTKHIAPPATAEQILRAVGVTAEDRATARRVLDSLGYSAAPPAKLSHRKPSIKSISPRKKVVLASAAGAAVAAAAVGAVKAKKSAAAKKTVGRAKSSSPASGKGKGAGKKSHPAR